mgnify:CR=1 FL=1
MFKFVMLSVSEKKINQIKAINDNNGNNNNRAFEGVKVPTRGNNRAF